MLAKMMRQLETLVDFADFADFAEFDYSCPNPTVSSTANVNFCFKLSYEV